MAEIVKMDVECVSLLCKNCPELELSVDTLTLTDGFNAVSHTNSIRCVHLEKCKELYHLMKMDWDMNHVRKT